MFVFAVLRVLVVVMVVVEVEHAVVFLGIVVVVVFGVGVAGGVLLLVHADGVLGLVEDGLVGRGGAGGSAGGGVARGRGVVVLDAGHLVGSGLGGGLVGVRHHVAVRVLWLAGCFIGRGVKVREGDSPLDLVGDAGDAVSDLVGGGLGAVRSGVVGDLWERCQPAMARGMVRGRTVVEILAAGVRHVDGGVVGWLERVVVGLVD